MDYWESVELRRHVNFDDFRAHVAPARVVALSTRGTTSVWDFVFEPRDVLLLGPESRGLPPDLLTSLEPLVLRIPMVPGARSLNLSVSAAVALYEALRQLRPEAGPG